MKRLKKLKINRNLYNLLEEKGFIFYGNKIINYKTNNEIKEIELSLDNKTVFLSKKDVFIFDEFKERLYLFNDREIKEYKFKDIIDEIIESNSGYYFLSKNEKLYYYSHFSSDIEIAIKAKNIEIFTLGNYSTYLKIGPILFLDKDILMNGIIPFISKKEKDLDQEIRKYIKRMVSNKKTIKGPFFNHEHNIAIYVIESKERDLLIRPIMLIVDLTKYFSTNDLKKSTKLIETASTSEIMTKFEEKDNIFAVSFSSKKNKYETYIFGSDILNDQNSKIKLYPIKDQELLKVENNFILLLNNNELFVYELYKEKKKSSLRMIRRLYSSIDEKGLFELKIGSNQIKEKIEDFEIFHGSSALTTTILIPYISSIKKLKLKEKLKIKRNDEIKIIKDEKEIELSEYIKNLKLSDKGQKKKKGFFF